MAVRTGTASQVDGSAGSSSTTVTVPADAAGVVAFFCHWDGGIGSLISALTLGGNSIPVLTQLGDGWDGADYSGVGVGASRRPRWHRITDVRVDMERRGGTNRGWRDRAGVVRWTLMAPPRFATWTRTRMSVVTRSRPRLTVKPPIWCWCSGSATAEAVD